MLQFRADLFDLDQKRSSPGSSELCHPSKLTTLTPLTTTATQIYKTTEAGTSYNP
jgi:hypothetical protein